MADSSSSMSTSSNRLHSASGANVTSTSTSLSGRKSSRRTDPKRANSVIFHRRQNSAIFSRLIGMRTLIATILSQLHEQILHPLAGEPWDSRNLIAEFFQYIH